MAIDTFATLVSAATEWLARDQDATLVARVPDFITLAEAKFNRILFHPKMETRSTTTVDTSDSEPEFVSLPTDFQTMRRIRLSGVVGKPRLHFMSQTQLEDFRYSNGDVAGQPVYFTITGDELELAPTPNLDYALEMVYRANLPALTASNTTNWLLTAAPDLYLYGTLLESAPYIKEDGRIQTWGGALSTVLDQINTLAERQSFDSGPTSVWLPGVTP